MTSIRGKYDMYDVGKYTDQELFQLLNLSSPTDGELEAAILHMVKKYSVMGTEGGRRLMNFFVDIYRHFFDVREGLENNAGQTGTSSTGTSSTGTSSTGTSSGNGNTSTNTTANAPTDTTANGETTETAEDAGEDAVDGEEENAAELEEPKIQQQQAVSYSKDKLNPLLTQTVTRLISVDSQYRENILTSQPTHFTFNLSEPLRDVVSLKLYSVQIPYSWYTINNSFGGNFFELKATAPGISNGHHDYHIEIASGNYSPDTLVTAINASIQTMAALPQNQDMDFGLTGISYSSPTCKATLLVDLQKTFNESNFYLSFPEWSSPNDPVARKNTLAGYLGFNETEYSCSAIYSLRDLALIDASPTSPDKINSVYTLDSSNCTFQVVCYSGPSYAARTHTVATIDVTVGLTLGSYSRNSLMDAVNTTLKSMSKLAEGRSYFQRIEITDPAKANAGSSYFKMGVQLNRLTTPAFIGSKLAVVFPDESYKATLGHFPVWVGADSCFHFKQRVNECNYLVAETSTLQTNYVVGNNNIRIRLHCNTAPYDVPFNTYDVIVPNSASTGYLLNDLVAKVNEGISTANGVHSLSDDHDDLNYPNTQFMVDPYTNLLDLHVDMNRIFRNSFYHASSTNPYFGTFSVDLSGNASVFTTVFNIASAYTLMPNDVLTIRPIMTVSKTVGGETYTGFVSSREAGTFTISASEEMDFLNYQDLQKGLNDMFINYRDDQGGYPLVNTRVRMEVFEQYYIKATLTLVVAKTLSQLDYGVTFYDRGAPTVADNIWVKKLFFLPEYDLATVPITQSVSTVTNTKILSDNQILVETNVNDTFYVKPYDNVDGLSTALRDYDVKIKIPKGTYTLTTLYNQINTLFAANPITQNTSMMVYSENGQEFTKIKMSMNQTFTTKDYRVTFYDTAGATSCRGGGSVKNATWDTTVGWILGYRNQPEYFLTDYVGITDTLPTTNLVNNYYNVNRPNMCVMVGDTGVSVNLYNSMMIILDDYTQNHLSDGLVTTAQPQVSLDVPSVVSYVCNPITGKKMVSSVPTKAGQDFTANQMYSNQERVFSHEVTKKTYSPGPYVKDVFAMIPMKLTGLKPGDVYVETSGTLQNQNRVYFGPVNIHRMTIKLLSDRGDLVDLNNTNWSFAIMCDIMYRQ